MNMLRIGMAQINCTVGDLAGNTEKIIRYTEKAQEMCVDILSFPEMAITGYPPEDLLLKNDFIDENLKYLDIIKNKTGNICVVVGFVNRKKGIYNAAAVIKNKKIAGIYHKMLLPNYGVFDEKRYFKEGDEYKIFSFNDINFGVTICEDIWFEDGPVRVLSFAGNAEIIININSSPYHLGKWRLREAMLRERARNNKIVVAYNNMVGGQDELVFDGSGMVLDANGNVIERGRQFEEELIIADIDVDKIRSQRKGENWQKKKRAFQAYKKAVKIIQIKKQNVIKRPLMKKEKVEPLSQEAEIYNALLLGTSDYTRKNGFKKVLIGLSGGIDSALTSAIAVDAIGKENVVGVFMPSMYTSNESIEDVEILSKNLGIKLITVPITETYNNYISSLAATFKDLRTDVTEENIQARIRGNILMALSNKFGWLVLTTGNKSEMSVGYATLYGDMAGGFAVIKDVPKTMVYRLSRYKNTQNEVIPERIIKKEPTAELRPGQKDSDSLPAYEILDPILQAYIEEDKSFADIAAMGFDKTVVKRVIDMVDKSEYKRRQSSPGIKITPKAFGKDRRMPITNWYKVTN
ncbi:MAG: NAD+ synthase [Nitrospirae bacterium]|nr:NAD+ synthase [Nitrospirota bacterium]